MMYFVIGNKRDLGLPAKQSGNMRVVQERKDIAMVNLMP